MAQPATHCACAEEDFTSPLAHARKLYCKGCVNENIYELIFGFRAIFFGYPRCLFYHINLPM